MDKITDVMASWEPFLLAFAIFVTIGVIRGLGTKKDSNGKVSGGWAQSRPFKLLLPLFPYVLSIGAIFIPGIPIPAKVGTAVGAKVLYAVWCGWLSDKTFEVGKRILEKGFGMQFGADKVAP